MPSWIKILLIPLLNILVFALPWHFAAVLLVLQTLLAFCLKFSLREQFKDLRPVLYYAAILYFIGFVSALCGDDSSDFYSAVSTTFGNTETLKMLLKLFCVMQMSSILFRTSTSLQIRDGIGKIESTVRKVFHLGKRNTFTDAAALFVCFIPMVFRNWELAKKAWFARGGKYGIRMFASIFPVFFSVGIRQAYNYSKALSARSR